jgi:signal transduction histidine kinase
VYLAVLLTRDYVLNTEPTSASSYRAQLEEEQKAIHGNLLRLGISNTIPQDKFEALRQQIHNYEQSVNPVLRWSPEEKAARSRQFIQENLIPERQAVLGLTEELSELNAQNRTTQQELLERSRASSQSFMLNLLVTCLGLGVIAVVVSVLRLLRMDKERRQASAALAGAREEEARRIARELHDDITQRLALLSMDLGKTIAKPPPDGNVIDACRSAQRKLLELSDGVRQLSHRLHPAILDDLGLSDALEDLCSDFKKRSGIPVQFQADGLPDRIHPNVAFCLYRIAQESLSNVSKYADAKDVRVSARVTGGAIQLNIADSGVGFDTASPKSGLGLQSMKERADLVGGKVRIVSTPGAGTKVVATVPLGGAAG